MTGKRSAEDIAAYLRDLADNPASSGFTPVHPETLREAAEEIEKLRRTVDNAWQRLGIIPQKRTAPVNFRRAD